MEASVQSVRYNRIVCVYGAFANISNFLIVMSRMTARIYFLFFLVIVSTATVVNCQLLQAVAYIQGINGRIQGNVTFSQNDGGTVTIWGKITGLPPGRHGFHIHETGDIKAGCSSTGAHYNPFKKNHGALTDPERHVGDLGNIVASPDGTSLISITDNVISLTGPYTILGRSIVVHADPDDAGKGGFSDSLKTGHSGSRIACGVIGLLTNVEKVFEPSSAVTVLPWKYLFLIILPLLRLN